jgi:hypothetical protein
MLYQLKFDIDALKDIDEIIAYITHNCKAPLTAKKYLLEIFIE